MRLDQLMSTLAPVIAALLPDDDVQEVVLTTVEAPEEGTTMLRLVVAGEQLRFYVSVPGQPAESPSELRHRLAEELQDFVAESRFGWGELRRHPF